MVKVIISKFGPSVLQVIESELRLSDKDRDRLGTLFDVIDKVSVKEKTLGKYSMTWMKEIYL